MKKTKLFTLLMTLILLSTAIISAGKIDVRADEQGEKLREARNGVLLVVVGVKTSGSSKVHTVSFGSGFLIGSTETKQYIVTNYHVLNIDKYKEDIAKQLDVPVKNLKTVINAVVTNSGGSTSELEFNPSFASEKNDLAVLEVKTKIYTSTSLLLSDDKSIKEADSVWSLGYPYDKTTYANDFPTYKNEDVEMRQGHVGKFVTHKGVKCIEHDATLAEGSSGGPLVDENGYVVGINRSGWQDGLTFYAIRVNQLKDILDTFNIQYDKAPLPGEQAVATTENKEGETSAEATTEAAPTVDKTTLEAAISSAQEIDADKYTDESYANLEEKLETANKVMNDEAATQVDVENAASELDVASSELETKSNNMMYFVIGGVAVVLIAILAVIMATRKKKPENASAGYTAPAPSAGSSAPDRQQAPPPVPSSSAAGFFGDGAEATSVLNEGAGETTLLSNQNMAHASLFRESKGENIKINKSIFVIGRERRKVDYCVSDNSSVGRTHAEIILKNGTFYLVDQKSTNGSYVNGVKVAPLQEVELKNGDKIRLSDEEFIFRRS